LFAIESEGLEQRCNQFVGFVASHKKGNVLVSFHIHSFAVFYTEEGPSTIVTCLLTARSHILLNMQDRILQIVQLIQYSISQLFSMVITINFIGEEVTLDENSVCGYKMVGFKTIGEDEESKIFSLRLEVPIPFSVFETHIHGQNMVITSYHQFCHFQVERKYNSMILFGNAS
jgi:hypothetical protein